MRITLALALAVSFCGIVNRTSAQSYSIDWQTLDNGGGKSTGGVYSVNASLGQSDAGRMSGGSYTVDVGFESIIGAGTAATTIFDNTSGSANGYEGATTNTWLAEKFCVRTQAYSLDSVTLLLVSGDNNGEPRPRSVRLQIYSNDPLTGKPSTNTGVIINLSGATNPITLAISYIETPVTWIPATPFVLAANQCYWAVLSTEGEIFAGQVDSFTMPTGDAASFGRASSPDAGATWGVVDNGSSRKMLIRGRAVPTAPELVITGVSISGNNLRFRFPARAGQNYVIESRADAAAGEWTIVPGTTGNGGNVQLTIPDASIQPRQFYRVRQWP